MRTRALLENFKILKFRSIQPRSGLRRSGISLHAATSDTPLERSFPYLSNKLSFVKIKERTTEIRSFVQ